MFTVIRGSVMKKCLILVCLLFSVPAFAAEYSPKFISSLKNCTSYSTTETSNVLGMQIYTSRQIMGWSNGKCIYKEIKGPVNNKYTFNCRFTQPQLNSLVRSALQSSTGKTSVSTDLTEGSASTSGDDDVWNEYMSNLNICTQIAPTGRTFTQEKPYYIEYPKK